MTITRFDIFDRKANEAEGTDEMTVFRFFEKRKLVGEVDLAEVTRFEDASSPKAATELNKFITAKPREFADVLDFLGEEEGEEDEDEGGSIVPTKYRIKYGVTQRCGDDVAETLSGYVTLPRANKAKDIDGGLDRAKLREVAAANGLADRLADYEARELNGGLLRMNISNILRGMVRRGERVVIGDKVWEARPVEVKAKPAKAASKPAKKGAKNTK